MFPRSTPTFDGAQRKWWEQLRGEIPSALPADVGADWRAIFRNEQRQGLTEDRAMAAANRAHTEQREALRVDGGALKAWSLGGSDDDVKDRAQALAKRCEHLLVQSRQIDDGTRLLSVTKAELRARCDAEALAHRCSPARGEDGPALNRYACPKWWRKALRKVQRQQIEQAKIAAGVIRVGRQVYCSDAQVRLRRNQSLRNRQTLEAVHAINDEGDEYTLAQLADVSPSNPAIRRSELMVRMRGFEDYAKARGHVARAFTFTCPSWMHPSDCEYQGTTPTEAQAWLNVSWARARAQAGREVVGRGRQRKGARAAIPFYGFRVAEPHKDGCPHWHAVLFFESDEAARQFKQIVRRQFLRDVHEHERKGGAPGYEKGAVRYRVKVEAIRGNATGYLAKYIAKNIDGLYVQAAHPDLFASDGTLAGFDVKAEGAGGEWYGKSIELAERVQAWATCWRIRQFQQIGGPPVTLWREFRRVEGELAGHTTLHGDPVTWLHQTEQDEAAETLREPCDGTRWSGMCEAWASIHEGSTVGTTPNVPKRERYARPVYWCPDIVLPETGEVMQRLHTVYGDVRAGQVAGADVLGKFFGTRFRQWTLRTTTEQMQKAVEQATARSDGAGAQAPEAIRREAQPRVLGVLSITVRKPATMEEAEQVAREAFARQIERMRNIGYIEDGPPGPRRH